MQIEASRTVRPSLMRPRPICIKRVNKIPNTIAGGTTAQQSGQRLSIVRSPLSELHEQNIVAG